ncbi:uncharacterized protein LOC113553629 [Rhopalosiphum maidis]|uniref:uncharacterized protein LOC113553629 n=1 Tax=Rhopalosiphum maidis TaxID=43146 RepID=UPI000EFF18E1|nr:uncharacterized protein LOC113553629 [Rhopalosiphum maidis]XP_026812856.1 uncharacterized protein LOC113553629 [Rhopalosiphum maidis]XP_026812858.1 uncharacterized protein LOC113553629 [Rhopalosiphum maidis]
MCLHTHADSATGRITRHGPAAHATRAPRTRTTMIAGTLVVAISCWSLFAAAAQHGSDRRSVHYDGDLVRSYRTSTSTTGGEHCCTGGQSLSTGDDNIADPFEIPLNVIMELNQVSNVSELFTKFMPDTNMDEAQRRFITTGFQSRTTLNLERKAAFIPKPATCTIESQTISLKDTDDRSLYYFPSCTRVDRCGGCCSHDLLACQPTKIETLHFEVLVSQYNGAGKLEFKGRKTVSIDRHLKCKCECIVKEENCSPLQMYNRKECRCKCSNEDDEDKCNDEHDLKQWNSATCKCECREIKECTSGYGFDNYTCGCEPLRIRTKNTGTHLNRNKYSLVVS